MIDELPRNRWARSKRRAAQTLCVDRRWLSPPSEQLPHHRHDHDKGGERTKEAKGATAHRGLIVLDQVVGRRCRFRERTLDPESCIRASWASASRPAMPRVESSPRSPVSSRNASAT